MPDINYSKLEYKPLNKLAVRLMKLYEIPDEMCPNITTRQSMRGLRYLLFKKYVEVSKFWLDSVDGTLHMRSIGVKWNF